MTTSKEPQASVTVYQKIAAVMAAISKEGIAKNRINEQQRYKFRGIDDVFNALSPILAAHRLLILPRVVKREQVERQTTKGGAIFYTTLTVEFDFISADDGSKHTVTTIGEAMDSADKSSNKAQSAAYKYAAFQAFAIPTEADNDADASHHDVAPQDTGPTEAGQAVLQAIAEAATEADMQAIKARIMALHGTDRKAAIAAGTARMAALRQAAE